MTRSLSDPTTLVGDWTLARSIDDRLTGRQSRIARLTARVTGGH